MFIEEKEKITIPLNKAIERTAKAVGKNVRTIHNLRKDCENAEQSGTIVTTPRKRRSYKKIEFDEFG